jgi:hypothetical protein
VIEEAKFVFFERMYQVANTGVSHWCCSDGTDGIRSIGRTCHSFLLRSYSQAETIFLSIDTQRLSKTISFFIRNAAQVQTPTGKYLLLNGLPFYIVLTRVNHSEQLRGSIKSRMRRYAVFFAPLV